MVEEYKITKWVKELKDNEIFVFGSNLQGIHGAGAAKTAMKKFGAVYGIGVGHTGRSWAFPTVYNIKTGENRRSLTIKEISKYIPLLEKDIKLKPNFKFIITEVGCNLAGHKVEDIAPLFKEISKLDNVSLPESFWKVILNK